MAHVFISYSRKDARRVRPVVKALERQGLTVWWDAELVAGSRFSAEIAAAIDAAAAVVVLWSTHSIESPWVLDEAARGRDLAKLVPASLGRVEPPIGFGQLHTIDLDAHRADGLRPLDALVAAVTDKVELAGTPVARRSPVRHAPRFEPKRVASGLLLLALLAAGGYWALGGDGGPADVADRGTVTVEPMVAAQGRKAEQAAATIVTQAISRTFANNRIITLEGGQSDADFGLRGTVTNQGARMLVDAQIVDPDSDRILWSAQIERDAGEMDGLGDQVAVKLADILRCAVYSLRRMPEGDGPELHARILRYCEAERSAGAQYGELPMLARALIEVVPKSAQAHAYHANALAFTRTSDIAAFRQAASEALKLDPDNGTIRWGLATVNDRSIALAERERLLREGMSLDPEQIWLKNNLATLMRLSGRYDEALRYWQEFVDDYPLDYHQRSILAYLVAENGSLRAARRLFDEIEKVRPAERNHKRHAMRSEALFGDPRRARSWAATMELEKADRLCLEMTIAIVHAGARPSADEIEGKCATTGATFVAEEMLVLAGHVDRALEALHRLIPEYNDQPRFGPYFVFERGFEAIRKDRRFIRLLHRMDVPRYWLDTGKFADFCEEDDLPYDCRAEAMAVVGAARR